MKIGLNSHNPEPRYPNQVVADLHIHTVASGHAFSTVNEIVSEAKKKGLDLITITDHGPALPGGAHLYHFYNLRVVPRKIEGIRILKGAEANITGPDGEIDLPEEVIKDLDIVLLALHVRCGYEGSSIQENTETILKAMERHRINVISHPGNPLFPLDFNAVAEKSKEKNIAIEFNNSSYLSTTSRNGGYKLDLELAKYVKKHGALVALGSDAHIASDVGNLEKSLSLVKKAGIAEAQVLNISKEKVLNFLKMQ